MKNSYNLFKSELESLKEYVNYQITTSKVLNDLKKKNILGDEYIDFNIAKSKIYSYNSYIITLYGLLERFIENLLTQYLTELSNCSSNYESLPQIIQDNNIQKNSELLLNLSLVKNKDIDSKELIEILNNNLTRDNSKLYPKAFTQHKSNFRHNSINEFFKNVGISNLSNEIRNYSPLKERLELDYKDIKNQKSKIIFNIIDDLAERRNDIAHGVENISLIHPNLIIEYIDFILEYCNSLFELVNNSFLEFKFQNRAIDIEHLGVIRNEILLCRLNKISIDMSSKIIVKRKNIYPKYFEMEIKEIQVNHKVITEIDGSSDIDVGVLLSEKISERNKFKLAK